MKEGDGSLWIGLPRLLRDSGQRGGRKAFLSKDGRGMTLHFGVALV